MAKKQNVKTEVEAVVNNNVNTEAPEITTMSQKIEEEVVKKIEEVSSEVTENIADIKTREENLLKQIENNPQAAQKIVEDEIKHVDEMMKKFDTKIQTLTEEVKNNKVFFTTESWNGWGYGN